jgi:hypothetical protein
MGKAKIEHGWAEGTVPGPDGRPVLKRFRTTIRRNFRVKLSAEEIADIRKRVEWAQRRASELRSNDKRKAG